MKKYYSIAALLLLLTLPACKGKSGESETAKDSIAVADTAPAVKPLLEAMQDELDLTVFPVTLDRNSQITTAYIDGNKIFYEMKVDQSINPSQVKDETISYLYENIIQNIKNNDLVYSRKDEMREKGINMVYVYFNNKGEEIANITITAADIDDAEEAAAEEETEEVEE